MALSVFYGTDVIDVLKWYCDAFELEEFYNNGEIIVVLDAAMVLNGIKISTESIDIACSDRVWDYINDRYSGVIEPTNPTDEAVNGRRIMRISAGHYINIIPMEHKSFMSAPVSRLMYGQYIQTPSSLFKENILRGNEENVELIGKYIDCRLHHIYELYHTEYNE